MADVWKYECSISFEPAHAEAVAKALSGNCGYDRCVSEVALEGGKVFIKMRAKDITALRASMNDYARLVRVCEYAERIR